MLGDCTDTGILTPHMLDLLRRCDGLVLESNHCPEMLANGPYPESRNGGYDPAGDTSKPGCRRSAPGFRKMCRRWFSPT